MNYKDFNSEDFIKDKFFVKWINEPCNETTSFWTKWIEDNPDKKTIIDEARQFVENVVFDIAPAPEGLADEMFSNIKSSITNISTTITRPETVKTKATSAKVVNLWTKKLVAAAVIGVMLFGATYIMYPWKVSYQTAFGETEKVELQDGSVVTLHGNSKLVVQEKWGKNSVRELTFEGEGVFEITQTPKTGARKCIVRTPNGAFIEVLGTTFTVTTWDEEVDVVLTEGKVNFTVPKLENQTTVLAPGEKITLNKDSKLVKENDVNTNIYNSWKNGRLTFDKTPVSEIVSLIENAHGYDVIVSNKEILNKEISGTFKEDVPTLLKALTFAFDLKIEQLKGNQILINK